jgi:hypothetical protein
LQLLVGLAGGESADISLQPGDDPGQFVTTHLFKDTGLEEDLWEGRPGADENINFRFDRMNEPSPNEALKQP